MKSRALLGYSLVSRFLVYLVLSPFALGQAKVDGVQPSPIVQTEFGEIVGKTVSLPFNKLVYEYLGIPYAQPPLGELRFSAPRPSKPWSGTKDTSKFGAMCPQPPFPSAAETAKNESGLWYILLLVSLQFRKVEGNNAVKMQDSSHQKTHLI